MKIILSRKGFDSSYGGYASPILPDGRMLSLPIPDHQDNVPYSSLTDSTGLSFYKVMHELKPNIRWDNEWHSLVEDTKCHLDPDLRLDFIRNSRVERGLFGQMDQSQSHLDHYGVTKNDLFLFFGWFRQTERNQSKRLQFTRGNSPDMHAIFGYLQVDYKLSINEDSLAQTPQWIKSHPHANPERKNWLEKKRKNTIYVSRENLSWNKSLPGWGIFNFSDSLVLTKKGMSRSKWHLPDFFKGANFSRSMKEPWKDGFFQSVPIGQEIIIQKSDNQTDDQWKMVENWAMKIVDGSYYENPLFC